MGIGSKSLLGEILIERKVLTKKQLKNAINLQKKEKILIGELLIKLGYVEEMDIVVALIIQRNFPYIAINKYDIDSRILKMIPEELAREFHVIPLDCVGDILSVVMFDPLNLFLQEKLVQITGRKIVVFIATKSEIDEAIEYWYGRRG